MGEASRDEQRWGQPSLLFLNTATALAIAFDRHISKQVFLVKAKSVICVTVSVLCTMVFSVQRPECAAMSLQSAHCHVFCVAHWSSKCRYTKCE